MLGSFFCGHKTKNQTTLPKTEEFLPVTENIGSQP